jgi:deoxyribose-phosphate aldolase
MNPQLIAEKLEAVAVAPDASSAQVHAMVTLAMQHQLAAIVIPPLWAQRVVTMVRPQPLRVCACVGFPHGTSKSTIKAIEATAAAKDGVDEIELVPHLAGLIKQDVQAVRTELLEIVRGVRATGRDIHVRVVLETPLLMRQGPELAERAIATGCQAARESGCDRLVTSTGFAGEADLAVLDMFGRHAHDLPIKHLASSASAAHEALQRGASRVGVDNLRLLEMLLNG